MLGTRAGIQEFFMLFHMPEKYYARITRLMLVCCMSVATTFIWAAEYPAPDSHGAINVKGEALEVRYAGSYTFLHLKTGEGEVWAAVLRTPVSRGDTVMIDNAIVMHNFESKPLKTTFRTILFGTLNGWGTQTMATHAGVAHPVRVNMKISGIIQVAKARGANALTVEEVNTKRSQFSDRVVAVRGRVVKINFGILGMNWVHLRDGTGSTVEATNDILVTTDEEVAIGEDVTAEGIVRTNVDFGSGYTYKVLIDDATFR
jgi:hypothetical protein